MSKEKTLRKNLMEFVSSHILNRTASSRAHFFTSLSLSLSFFQAVIYSCTHIIRTFAASSIHYATAEGTQKINDAFFLLPLVWLPKKASKQATTIIAALDLKIWFEGQAHSAHGIFSFIFAGHSKFTTLKSYYTYEYIEH